MAIVITVIARRVRANFAAEYELHQKAKQVAN